MKLTETQAFLIKCIEDNDSSAWNEWSSPRERNPILKDLKLQGVVIENFKFQDCVFENSKISNTTFKNCTFSNSDFDGATLKSCNFHDSYLHELSFKGSSISSCNFSRSNNRKPILHKLNFEAATIMNIDFVNCSCKNANFSYSKLSNINFHQANLKRSLFIHSTVFDNLTFIKCNLQEAIFSNCNITNSKFYSCNIEGTLFWKNNRLNNTHGNYQKNLILRNTPTKLTVEHIETAQFISMVDQERLDEIINEITDKAVLILGRFKEPYKVYLETIRRELRALNLVPIIFDFNIPDSRDVTETITLLARISKFIIADLTAAKSIQQEITSIVPHVAVPLIPIVKNKYDTYSMFRDFWKYNWVLEKFIYSDEKHLISNLRDKIIDPAMKKSLELNRRRSAAW